ncbi:hypothetical protein J2810_002542 [Chryseobacterium rhizosphaerae]|nr:hypothetical protein [Chryseobacterium rhizosphaerae]
MKNLKILAICFLVTFGSISALSFSKSDRQTGDQYGYFYVNPDGSRGAEVSGTESCSDQNEQLCAQEYNITTGQPTGNSAKMHFGPRL